MEAVKKELDITTLVATVSAVSVAVNNVQQVLTTSIPPTFERVNTIELFSNKPVEDERLRALLDAKNWLDELRNVNINELVKDIGLVINNVLIQKYGTSEILVFPCEDNYKAVHVRIYQKPYTFKE